ncbi:MAG: division/cell wall cluster transcriptional repressor MraZ, partial [Acidobacteria bacterium 21-70-11]
METFRGSYQATVDDKGRLKLPARLKGQLEEWHG